MATTRTDTRTRLGRCPVHGDVTAEKAVPQFKFPFVIVFLARRLIAAFQPYRCPACGARSS